MSKTPVSILQEYCARNMIVPQYDLVINGVGTHDPLFKYKLTVNEVITYGTGKSKKEAKHEAAKAAISLLPRIYTGGSCSSSSCNNNNSSGNDSSKFGSYLPHQPKILDRVEDITSPYHGALKENAIGELITICCLNKLPAPEYVLIGEEGPPHAKLFTFECLVAHAKVVAASRTKKQAKHLAAKAMLQRLVEMFGEKLELSPPDIGEDGKDNEKDNGRDEVDENAKLVYANLKTTKINENFDLLISDYHTIDLTPIFGDNPTPVIKLSHYSAERDCGIDSVTFLEELFKDAEVGIAFEELPSIKSDRSVVVCNLDSCPTFSQFGVSFNNYEEAKRKAAHEMVCLLKLFCH